MAESEVDKKQVAQEVAEIKQKNSQTLAQLRELFDKTEHEKHARDKENSTVKSIASHIEEIRKQVNELQSKVNSLEKELAPLKRSLGNAEKIKSEIQSLEYSLHVNYSTMREKAVSRQIKDLSTQLKKLQASSPKLHELSALKTQLREKNYLLGESVKQLKAHARQSEIHHQAMLAIFKQADALQTNLPRAFNQLDEKRNTLSAIRQVENQQRKKEHEEFEVQRKIQKQEQAKKMEKVKEKAKEILEKFKLGKSISFEELQILQVAGLDI